MARKLRNHSPVGKPGRAPHAPHGRILTEKKLHKLRRRISFTQMIALLVAFVLVAGIGGVLSAGLAIPLAVGANAAADQTFSALTVELPAELEPKPLSEASFIYDSEGNEMAALFAQNRIVVPLDEINPDMIHAMISIEDENFYEHGGIDIRGMIRGAANNIGGGSTQGASTLTQQYVKNLLIDEALREGNPFGILEAREKTIARKLREARYAIGLNETMTKDEILEGYLNVAQFGASVFGVETAAKHYFSKSASELNAMEAATIAGITKAPTQYDPIRHPVEAEKRRDVVLNKMWQLGYIDTDTYTTARATTVKQSLNVTPISIGCQAAEGAEFFCDFVVKTIMTDPTFGETASDRSNLLYRGGLRVYTTLVPKLQKAATETVRKFVPPGNSVGLESVIVTIEPGTGEIWAMTQNKPYDVSADPAPGTTSINYAADFLRGGSRGFQPGSTYKPFVLAEWLKSGRTLADHVNANVTTYTGSSFSHSCQPKFGGFYSTPWTPANTDGSIGGSMPVLQATYLSINTAYVSMGRLLDLCSLRDTAWQMGFRPTQTMDGQPVTTASSDNITVTPTMLLGVQETAPMYMAAAFSTIASGGTYCSPIAITKIVANDGTEMPVPSAGCYQGLPPNVANTMAAAMQNGFTRGTAYGLWLEDRRPAAGKTGTAQGSAQTWFTGFVPQMTTTVWVGEANGNARHMDVVLNGNRWTPMYGGDVAAPTWLNYMNQAVEGLPVKQFPAPDPALVGGIDVTANIPLNRPSNYYAKMLIAPNTEVPLGAAAGDPAAVPAVAGDPAAVAGDPAAVPPATPAAPGEEAVADPAAAAVEAELAEAGLAELPDD